MGCFIVRFAGMNRLFLVFLLAIAIDALAQRPSDAQIQSLLAEGRQAMEEQDFQTAENIFTKLIASTGLQRREDFQFVYQRAVCRYYQENPEAVLEDLALFGPEMESVPQPHLLRSLVLRDLGRNQELIGSVDRALALHVAEMESQLLRLKAEAYMNLNELDSAQEVMRKSLIKEPTPDGYGLQAFILYRSGDLEDALGAIHKAVELDYSYAPAYRYATTFCLQEGDYQRALVYSGLGMRVDPEDPDMIYFRGIALVETGQLDAGCRYLNKAFYSGNEDAGYYLEEHCYPIEK